VDRQRRRDALDNLAEMMQSWDYTREEILAAWDLAQVKKVMES
jgi:hypothetical protein